MYEDCTGVIILHPILMLESVDFLISELVIFQLVGF